MKRGTMHPHTHQAGGTRRDSAAAFTLTELIVVMAAIALLLAVAVPSFAAMIASQRRSLAQGQLQSALSGARTLALQQQRGTDTAAVFTFEPGGAMSVVACVQVGSIPDMVESDPDDLRTRDVFVPDPAIAPVSLPGGWMVRGLVTESDTTSEWYDGDAAGRSNWVFPETGFYDKLEQLDGVNRQSFMIRFEGGTGRVKADNRESLALLRRPSTANRNSGYELDMFGAENPARFVRQMQGDAAFMSTATNDTLNRADVLGDVSSDTVLIRPVWALTLYREQELADALGSRVDRDTGVLYEPYVAGGAPLDRRMADIDDASNWLETQDLSESTAFPDATPGGLIFAINRADGSLIDLVEDAGEGDG